MFCNKMLLLEIRIHFTFHVYFFNSSHPVFRSIVFLVVFKINTHIHYFIFISQSKSYFYDIIIMENGRPLSPRQFPSAIFAITRLLRLSAALDISSILFRLLNGHFKAHPIFHVLSSFIFLPCHRRSGDSSH